MKKVYQTIIDKDHGNCMQAAIASLLGKDLVEVPNFIESEKGTRRYEDTMMGYLHKVCGYDACTVNKYHHETTEFLKKVARFDGGVGGYFYATVPSQTFPDCMHAVIVDMDLNIVHDPNPNGNALKLTPDDVLDIMVMHEMIIGKTGTLFTKEEWCNINDEERDLNTYRCNDYIS